MQYAPINPSDIYYGQGVYGIKPQVPAILGFEGVGMVEQSQETSLIGKKVACFSDNGGTFAEYLVCDKKYCLILDDQFDDKIIQKFACSFINPLTALAFLDISYDKIIQTAGFSALGKMNIKLFEQNGIQTVNIVRKQEQIEQLYQKYGTYKVLNSQSETFLIELKNEMVSINPPKIFFDSVGDKLCGEIFNALPSNSITYSFGVMSHKKISEIDPISLVFQQKQLRGFWLSRWLDTKSELEINDLKNQVKKYILDQTMESDIANIYEIDDINNALQEYRRNMSNGKILLKM